MPYSSTLSTYFGISETSDLLVTPLASKSLAMQIPTQIQTPGATFRIPVVAQDPSAAWVLETEEIPTSEASGDEIEITPRKVAGLVLVSNETASDTNPEAAQIIGDGLARDIGRKIDRAYFGPAPTGPAALRQPAGLEALEETTLIDGFGLQSIDPFIDALAAADEAGVAIDAWIADPESARTLAKLKTSFDGSSNIPLLGTDAANGVSRTLLGVPLVTSPDVVAGVWGLSKAISYTVLREDVTVDVDRSRYFERDVVAIRGRLRVGFGFTHPAGIVKVSKTQS